MMGRFERVGCYWSSTAICHKLINHKGVHILSHQVDIFFFVCKIFFVPFYALITHCI
jgi:hypothetical protein